METRPGGGGGRTGRPRLPGLGPACRRQRRITIGNTHPKKSAGPCRQLIHPHTTLTVDLDAVAANLAALRALMPAGARIAGVVKADAYGHGLIEVSRRLAAEGCEALAVATMGEGLALRAAGIELPVLLLLGILPAEAPEAIAAGLTPVIADVETGRALSQAARAAGAEAFCQFKVDTGMGRLGVEPGEALALLEALAALPGLTVTGLASHLATGGEPGDAHAAAQTGLYAGLLAEARDRGHALADSSLAASGGVLAPPPDLPGPPGLARIGISLYGGLPSPGSAGAAPLKDAMSLTTRLIAVRKVAAGTPVSYGCTWTAPADTVLGVVPLGYANGYLRGLSGRAQALVGGRRAPLRGRVCMNLCVLELGIGAAERPGDEVVLLGEQQGERIGLEELAGWAGTISYELTCALGAANPRRFSPA